MTAGSPSARERARWRHNFFDEAYSANLYEALGKLDPDSTVGEGLARLADAEHAQARLWAERLSADEQPSALGLRPAGRLFLWLARRFGIRAIAPALAANELRHMAAYLLEPDGADFAGAEWRVARQAWALTGARRPQAAAEAREPWRVRRGAQSGSLRAAVFGVNDGLVSNLSLIMGVAGAAPLNTFILLAGFAGLVAGSFSMAGGEFISMLSQRELFERQIEIERSHILLAPASAQASLASRYVEKGLPVVEAEQVAVELMANPEHALDTIVREELGLNPEELGSPARAARASFASFAVGGLVPLVPFIFLSGWAAVIVSAALSALALFLVGVGVAFTTGRSFTLSGIRMVAVGAGAAILTFLIGRLVGVNVAG